MSNFPGVSVPQVPYSPPPPWRVLTEAGYFAGLCVLLGGLAVILLAVLPAHRGRRPGDAAGRRHAFAVLPAAGLAMIVLLYLQEAALATRAGDFGFTHGLRPDVIADFLTASKEPGEWIARSSLRAIQVVLLAAAAVSAIAAGRRHSPRLAWAARRGARGGGRGQRADVVRGAHCR